jgi:hypothetical protein
MRRRTLASAVAIALCVLAACGSSALAAPAKPRPPTKLWKAFPLLQQVEKPHASAANSSASLPSSSASREVSALVIAALAMMIALSAALAIKPGLVHARPGRRRWIRAHLVRGEQPTAPLELPAGEDLLEALRPTPAPRVCEIGLSRGPVQGQLFATVAGSDEPFATSREFPLPHGEDPTEYALEELDHFRGRLERAGWRLADGGSEWYEREAEPARDHRA